MTFQELMEFLDQQSGFHFIQGKDLTATLEEAKNTGLPNPLLGKAILAIHQHAQCQSLDDPITRTDAFNAIGPLRLSTMADDAHPDDVKTILKLTYEIDKAFDFKITRE